MDDRRSTLEGDYELTNVCNGSTCTGSAVHPQSICRRYPVVAPTPLKPVSAGPSGFPAVTAPDDGISMRASARSLGRLSLVRSRSGRGGCSPFRRGRSVQRKPARFVNMAAAADMRGCGSQTPSSGQSIPNTDHESGQPSTLLGADELKAPQARLLVRRGNTGESVRPLCGRTFAGEKLGRQDSNLGSRDQNPLPYHLATPQRCFARRVPRVPFRHRAAFLRDRTLSAGR